MKILYRAGYILLLLLPFTACQKVYDYIKDYPTTENKNCGIARITYQDPYITELKDTLRITYNSAGNPLRIDRPEPRTGAPNYRFLYKNGRLTDFIGIYSNEMFTEEWHRYRYDNKDRIIIDSVYSFSTRVNNQPVNYHSSYRIDIQYDNKDRVIHETYDFSGSIFREVNYSYDLYGNRVGGNYDNRVNFLRTNKIWMFLNRDYSVNNSFQANAYNNYDLPLSVTVPPQPTLVFLQNYMSNDIVISYQCK